MYNIHLLPATFGDSILIEYGSRQEKHYILIDGGPYYVFEELWAAIQHVAPGIKELELLVITHIDIDHIDGIVTLLNQQHLPLNIKEVWFNGREELEEAARIVKSDQLGSLQGEYLTALIKGKYRHNSSFSNGIVCVPDREEIPVVSIGDMKIQLLAPGVHDLARLIPAWDEELEGMNTMEKWKKEKRYPADITQKASDMLGDEKIEDLQDIESEEDKSAANCSSIAFIAAYEGKSCLFAGDAPSNCLLATINPLLDKKKADTLEVDAWKLAHHGSKKSSRDNIMKKISSKNILVSSDGKRYQHPDVPVIAKLLKYGKGTDQVYHFNYRTKFNERWDDSNLKKEYQYETAYPDTNEFGITIKL